MVVYLGVIEMISSAKSKSHLIIKPVNIISAEAWAGGKVGLAQDQVRLGG